MQSLTEPGLANAAAAEILQGAFVSDVIASNLGRLHEANFGKLHIVNVWGPAVLAGRDMPKRLAPSLRTVGSVWLTRAGIQSRIFSILRSCRRATYQGLKPKSIWICVRDGCVVEDNPDVILSFNF